MARGWRSGSCYTRGIKARGELFHCCRNPRCFRVVIRPSSREEHATTPSPIVPDLDRSVAHGDVAGRPEWPAPIRWPLFARELVVEARYRPHLVDPQARPLLVAAHRLGLTHLAALEARRLYYVTLPARDDAGVDAYHTTGDTPGEDAAQRFMALLHDPLLHEIRVEDAEVGAETWRADSIGAEAAWAVDVTYRPGVHDPEGDGVTAWWADLYPDAPAPRLRTGRRYLLTGDLAAADVRRLATGVLANPLIQDTVVRALSHGARVSAEDSGPPRALSASETSRMQPAADAVAVEEVSLDGLDDEALAALSARRSLALSAPEMRAIQAYFVESGRAPTDAELETFALTWSEHCCHKTFRAPIDYTEVGPDGQTRRRRIDGLLRSTIVRATRRLDRKWVRSAFVDNAGLIAFDARHDIALKVETHNHPSAIEPFGGANTGVGGVIRDVLAVSARPIAATDALLFGHPASAPDSLPAGVLAPARVAAGVIAGVADYGNKMGVPIVSGAIVFDDGYAANPLVFCGCIGLAPRDRPSEPPQPGDLVVTIGGRTGRDGVHGATFSSADLDAVATATLGSAVQIGEPIVEKRVGEALERLRERGLYRAMTDCGAGGFCSAVGELGAATGVEVALEQAPLKYPGLRPWEIWLSESQERMVLAIPPARWPAARTALAEEGVEGAVIGRFTGDGRLRVSHRGHPVVDLPMATLHEGRPRATLTARWEASPSPARRATVTTVYVEAEDGRAGRYDHSGRDPGELLLRLLAHPTIASKAEVIRRYDHEVQGATARGPLNARGGPSDAAVLAPVPGSRRGLAVACGLNPWYGRVDPYGAALLTVEETLRNLVAAGGDPRRAALLDNFAWGNPNRPEVLGALVRAAEGCHDASIGLGAPFVSGKDSLYNEYRDPDGVAHAIPGTLLITGVAIVPDVRRTPGTALRHPGDLLYIVGVTGAALGGSHLTLVDGAGRDDDLPVLDLGRSKRTLHALARAIRRGLVRACHDLSEGGLAVALAEMALGGGHGLRIDLARVPLGPGGLHGLPPHIALFAETPTRFVVAVAPEDAAAFEAALSGVPVAHIGAVADDERMVIHGQGGVSLLDLDMTALRRAWETPLGTDGRSTEVVDV